MRFPYGQFKGVEVSEMISSKEGEAEARKYLQLQLTEKNADFHGYIKKLQTEIKKHLPSEMPVIATPSPTTTYKRDNDSIISDSSNSLVLKKLDEILQEIRLARTTIKISSVSPSEQIGWDD